MASRYFTQLQTLGANRVRIGGSFTTGSPDGDSFSLVTGLGFIVQNNGPGSFQIIFDDKYFGIESSIASVGTYSGPPANTTVNLITPEDPANPGVYLGILNLFASGTQTTVQNCTVNFEFIFVNTGITQGPKSK